jgi:AraC-like DNA-binding protein
MQAQTDSFALDGSVSHVGAAAEAVNRNANLVSHVPPWIADDSMADLPGEADDFERHLERRDRPGGEPALGKSRFSASQLQSVMTELYTALRSAMDDERSSAEDSLRRVAEILQARQAKEPAANEEIRGGLSPWQIRKVTNHIEAHLDRPIVNGDLAGLVRLTPCHFGRAFRNSFGVPPHEYVIRRRVEHAQGLMLSTGAPLSQIALDCGLSDQSHLSRLFRRVVGESPSAWRRVRISAPGPQ